jgi:hypothetical protein
MAPPPASCVLAAAAPDPGACPVCQASRSASGGRTVGGAAPRAGKANLDEGDMWPVYYALSELTAVAEAKIVELMKQAAS